MNDVQALEQLAEALPTAQRPARFGPYAAYANSGMKQVPLFPTNWRWQRLRFVADVIVSNVDKNTRDEELATRICNYVDVYKNTDIISEMDFMQGSVSLAELEKFTLKHDDVVITKDSEDWEDIAVPAHVAGDIDDVVCGYHLAILRPIPDRIKGRFLLYALLSPVFNYHFRISANGITRFGLTYRSIKDAPIFLPPLHEQLAIAEFLDDETAKIDALIAKKQRLIELLKEKRTALITHAVTKGINPSAPMKPSGIDWIGDIPAHWKQMSFRWCCRIPSGQVDPKEADYAHLPLIAPDHISSSSGLLQEYETADEQGAISGKYIFEAGTVLYSKIRPALAKVCIAPERGLCSADMYPFIPEKCLTTSFLFYQILSRHFTQQAILVSERVAMPKVNRDKLGGFPMLIPQLDEQLRICTFLDEELRKVDRLILKIEAHIGKLQEYRSALITAAVTGKIDLRAAVNDPSTASAAT